MNKNQPAFPIHNHGPQTLGLHVTGMSLRDYFAAKAMQSAMNRNELDHLSMMEISESAYKIADAMLEVRQR